MIQTYKTVKKIFFASILTGALLFKYDAVLAQESIALPNSIQQSDSVLLVKNDSLSPEPVSFDTTFTIVSDTIIEAETDTMRKTKIRSPLKAGLYSAIIPGFGQAYNHKYWKIPFIYIGGGFLISYSIYYNDLYKEYKSKVEEEHFKPDNEKGEGLEDQYKIYRDGYRKNRDRLILFAGLVYAANVVDAIVDAYFTDFDISDNLSLKVKPSVTYPNYAFAGASYGMSFRLTF